MMFKRPQFTAPFVFKCASLSWSSLSVLAETPIKVVYPMLNQNTSASNALTGSTGSLAMPVLLVDSDPELRDSRSFLLSALSIPVSVVGSYEELCSLPTTNSYNLVALTVRPDEKRASQIAEYVRRRWPKAKILLLGESCGCVEDPLYDDIVNPRYNPAALVQAAQRLLESVRIGRIFP